MASRGKRPNGAFEKSESGRCEAGTRLESSRGGDSCDIGLCLQPGTEALDVAVEKKCSQSFGLAWVFFSFVVGFFPRGVWLPSSLLHQESQQGQQRGDKSRYRQNTQSPQAAGSWGHQRADSCCTLALLRSGKSGCCLFPSPGRGWVVGGRCCWWPRRGKVGSPGLTSCLPSPLPQLHPFLCSPLPLLLGRATFNFVFVAEKPRGLVFSSCSWSSTTMALTPCPPLPSKQQLPPPAPEEGKPELF